MRGLTLEFTEELEITKPTDENLKIEEPKIINSLDENPLLFEIF